MKPQITALTVAAAAALATVITGCRSTVTPAPANAVPAAAAFGGEHQASNELAQLRIAPEDTGNHYNREQDWPHWDPATDAGRGCDVRDKVLLEQGRGTRLSTDGRCTLTGTWTSPYDDVTVTSASKLQIDHVVPLKEANQSGVRDWSRADRERFANDTRFLMAVTIRSNEQKGDQDPATWLPSNTGYRCTYAALWVHDKATYHLTVDQAEHDALASILARCS
jgi:hypothetical protein